MSDLGPQMLRALANFDCAARRPNMNEQLPTLFYVAGSICFLVGSLISLARSLT